jgi:hypothetical protein
LECSLLVLKSANLLFLIHWVPGHVDRRLDVIILVFVVVLVIAIMILMQMVQFGRLYCNAFFVVSNIGT